MKSAEIEQVIAQQIIKNKKIKDQAKQSYFLPGDLFLNVQTVGKNKTIRHSSPGGRTEK